MANVKLSDTMARQLRWTADLVNEDRKVVDNGKNRTTKALVDRGLIRFVELENPTMGSRYGVEITDAGWDFLAAEFGTERPARQAPVAEKAKSQRLSSSMEDALVYLGRGVHRAHLEPESRSLIALERRGLIEWADSKDTGRTRDITRLWTVTDAGWDYLEAEFGMQRPAPADPGRLTVDQAWEDTVVTYEGRMVSWSETLRRFREAYQEAGGNLTDPEIDRSGITAFLEKLGLATPAGTCTDGTKVGYHLSAAGWVAAETCRPFWLDEDGVMAMDPDVLAVASVEAHARHQVTGSGTIRTTDPKPVGTSPVPVPGVLDAPLTIGQAVEVRRSTFDMFNRSWTAQPSFSATYAGPVRNGLHLVLEDANGTEIRVRRQEIHPENRLSLSDALTLADMMRRTGVPVDGFSAPVGWPTA